MLIVITFSSDKLYGLVDMRQRMLEGNTAAGRRGKSWSAFSPPPIEHISVVSL
jgi:hypothetical protein